MQLAIFHEFLRIAANEGNKTLAEVYAYAYRLGYRAIDVSSAYVRENPEEIRAAAAAGLPISSIYDGTDLGRGEASDNRAVIDLAVRFGATRVMLMPGLLDEGEARDSESGRAKLAAMVEGVRRTVAYAKEKGVTVTLENFGNRLCTYKSADDLLYFTERIPDLRLTLDTGNFAYANTDWVSDAYARIKGKLAHVHLKDWQEEPQKAATPASRGIKPCAVGDGYLPLADIVRGLQADGYEGYLTIEQFDVENQTECMKRSADYVKKLLEM